MKKINFVLSSNYDRAVGGFKIVYQYANELVKRGYEVKITYLFNAKGKSVVLAKTARFINNHVYQKVPHKSEVTWFDLEDKIELFFDVTSVSEFPDADIVIATAALTTQIVSKLPQSKGEKLYFIQDYETERFGNTVEEVEHSYRLGFQNVVISHELSDIVEKATGIKPKYLPNFYDHSEFYLEHLIEERTNTVCLINHIHETKRTKFGLEILEEVKKQIPDLKIELFGAYDPVCQISNNVHFTLNATPEQLRKNIYGQSKIYLLPSVREGWVLTGMEAMASGAVVVASEIGGIVDYANSGNSVLITPDDKEAFVLSLLDLLANDEKRIQLAKKAQEEVQQYEISHSGNLLVEILEALV